MYMKQVSATQDCTEHISLYSSRLPDFFACSIPFTAIYEVCQHQQKKYGQTPYVYMYILWQENKGISMSITLSS